MQLSKRMQAIADMVTEGNVVADIGTDHSYIPIYLVENKIVPRALAMDINMGPLERAENHIKEHGLEDYIQVRLSPGLEKLNEGDADTIIIAGMGGLLTVEILSEGFSKLKSFKEIILQPQSDIENVRRFMNLNNFEFVQEEIVKDEGKFYFIMKAVKGKPSLSEDVELIYGKKLLENRHPVLLEFINKEKEKYENIKRTLEQNKSDSSICRLREVDEILKINEMARCYWR